MITIQTFYEASFFLIALVLSFSAFLFQLLEGRTKKRQNIIFTLLLLSLIASSACSTVCSFTETFGLEDLSFRAVFDAAQYLYFLSHSLLAPLFYIYVVEVSGAFYRQKTSTHILSMLPCVASEILVLINPLTHWTYRTDWDYTFTRGWGEYVIYGAAALYFVLSAVFLLRYSYVLTSRRRSALLYSFALVLAGVLLQLFIRAFSVELMFEALGFMGALLHVEKEDDRLDAATLVYNRHAMQLDIANYARLNRPFLALCVRIIDSDILQRITGSADSDALLALIAQELKSIFPSYQIYRSSPSSFLLLSAEQSLSQMNNVAAVIAKRFEGTWDYRGQSINLSATELLASVPDEFTPEDVILLADGALPAGVRGQVLTGDALSFLRRNVEIEEALARALTEHTLEVYYEPVYDWKKRSIYGASTVLRIRDKSLGMLWQDEFLPIAIENGTLDQLGDFLMREIAMFLGSGIPTDLGLEKISITVPAVQCMQPDFLSSLWQTAEQHGVRPSQVNLAILDISMVSDQAALSKTLEALRGMGFSLMLDRYGVGNAGLHALGFFSYDAVMIDLGTIATSARVDVRRKILINSIRMVGALGFRIWVHGLSEEAQLQTLEETDIHFVSGPFFSEPVSQTELIAILRATDLSRQEKAKARAQSDAKSSFLANMSHEIRTPINAILGMNEMILRESKDETIRSYAHDIARAGTTLLSLINDILDFSKIEAGNMEIVEAEYDLSSVIHDVVNMIRVKTEEKGLTLSVDVDERLPERLYGDEMRLRQILVNLLNNAVKYTEKGGVTLRMRGGFAEGKNVLLTCDIIDTGIGIREEEQSQLFEKFRRLDLTQNRTVEGSGLGLSIAANLLSLMNGTIEVQSMYGVGSTFTVKLTQFVIDWTPIGDLEKRYLSYTENERREEEKEAFTAPDARILVVDDTHINLTVIRALLKRTELQIDTASSGMECLSLIQKKAYDLIFLDYRMPEMDGSETLRRMKADSDHLNTETPVIVLTANALTGAKDRFLSEGFDDYIAKPIDTQKMEALLMRHLPKEKVILSERKGEVR